MKKIIEGNVHYTKANHPSKPAAYRQCGGGGETKRALCKTNHRQNPPAYRRRGGGCETKKGELKENTGAKTRETKVKTIPQATIVAGGRDRRRKPTQNGKVAQPTVPRGGEVPSRKRISKEKKTKTKTTCITKERRQNIQSCATV